MIDMILTKNQIKPKDSYKPALYRLL